MDCKQVNEFLMDYLYQELEPAQAERFEAHLHGCPGCTDLVGGFEQTRSAFAELPEEDPPAAVSALLLREAARAAAPPRVGFWEQLRQGMRALVMHPAMTVATTMVLVLGVSFYVYKQGPAPSSREAIDVPLLDESPALDPDRTAAIGVGDREKSVAAAAKAPSPAGGEVVAMATEKKEAQQKPAPPAEPMAQAPPAIEGGYDDLKRLGKDGSRARRGASGRSPKKAVARRQVGAVGFESDNDALDDLAEDAFNQARRDRAAPMPEPKPAAAPSPAPRPSPVQLAKRNEKASAKGWGGAASGPAATPPADQPASGGSAEGNMAPAASRTVAVARPRKKPARKRRTVSKNKADDKLGSLQFWKSGGKKLASGSNEDGAGAAPAEEAEERQAETKQIRSPRTAAPAKPAPRAADKVQAQAAADSSTRRAQTLVEQGHLSADSRMCAKAFEYYHQAIGMQPSLRTDRELVARVRRCVGVMSESSGDVTVQKAQKRYSRLASLIGPELERRRSARASRKQAAEQKKRPAKKSKAKKRPAAKSTSAY